MGQTKSPPRIMLVMSGRKRSLSGVLPMCGALALVLMVGCQRNISGSYLAGDKSAVVWLQVVRTPDNHLTGQMAANALKPDGTIDKIQRPSLGLLTGRT